MDPLPTMVQNQQVQLNTAQLTEVLATLTESLTAQVAQQKEDEDHSPAKRQKQETDPGAVSSDSITSDDSGEAEAVANYLETELRVFIWLFIRILRKFQNLKSDFF